MAMPTTTTPQEKMNSSQDAKRRDFIAGLKLRAHNGETGSAARQLALSNRGSFSAPVLKAFVQSNPALNNLRYVYDDQE